MKTPITYYGGKQSLIKHLLPLIPSHKIYCEPFFGGGALFFAKPKSDTEVINDQNGEVVNFFKVVKTKFSELQKEVKGSPHSRELFKRAKAIYDFPDMFSDVQRAWAFWILTNQGFAGIIGSWGFGKTNSKEKAVASKRDDFTKEYADRFKTVQVEHNDALKVIDRCDDKDAFMYCDPPYIDSDQGHYAGYGEQEYELLLKKLSKIKGKFLLSSYPNPLLNKYIKKNKWKVKRVKKSVAVTKLTDKQKVEMMVMNYEPPAESLNGIEEISDENYLDGLDGFDSDKQLAFDILHFLIKDKNYEVRQLKKMHIKFEAGDFEMEINGGKLYLKRLNGKTSNIQYPLDSLWKDLLDEIGQNKYETVFAFNDKLMKVIKKESNKKNSYAEIAIECKFIERFLEFNDKILYKNTFGFFIDDLQRAIEEKKIRKNSPAAKEIIMIQKAAVDAFNKMYSATHFVLKPATIKRLKAIVVKWQNSYDDIDVEYAKSKKKTTALNGIMPSIEFANLQFNTLGFSDKWLKLIGDPSPGFTAMVFGKPKMGKSYLCIDFAGYLARKFGKVLYVAREENMSPTLSIKMKDKEAAHENLFITGELPKDLSAYDFIFLDSVNSLNLLPEDLRKLKEKNPGKSFVFVFQTTKDGNFRGANTFQHDVDIVIEIPERGKAVQFGRFNQGGEMNIFQNELENEDHLNGTPKKKYPLWTTPKHLNERDHYMLKHIYDLYKEGNLKEAYDYACHTGDTVIREEIPGEIWKKLGGQLTPNGEEKLKAKKRNASPKVVQEKKTRASLVFTYGVRVLKDVIEKGWKIKLTDAEYTEILEIAEERNNYFVDEVTKFDRSLNEVLATLHVAFKEWERNERRF